MNGMARVLAVAALSSVASRRPVSHATEHGVAERSLPRTPQAPRNQPCPCGSGKKFKKCCRVVVTRD